MNADIFIKQFLPVALKVEEETGFKRGIIYLAMLVQSALETGWGKRVKGNNYFGIKGKGQYVRTKEQYPSKNVKIQGGTIHSINKMENGWYEYDVTLPFSYYPNPIDSFRDYVRFIRENPRYKKALEAETIEDYLRQVARAGYATDRQYEGLLLQVLESVRKRLPKS